MADTLVIIPTYNERDNVEHFARSVLAAQPEVHLLFVDDNSPDGTGEIIEALGRESPRVFGLHRPGKLGLGTAYLDGFAWGLDRGYARLFEMDADGSHDPRHLSAMLAASQRGADVVVGSRYVEGGGTVNWGFGRQLISRGGGFYARSILGVEVRDLTSGFICWRADALRAMDLATVKSNGYSFQIEMKYRALKRGFSVVEVPIVFVDRRVGQSKMSSKIFREALTMVWKLRLDKKI